LWRRWQRSTSQAPLGTSLCPTEESLVYRGEVFINFRNHTYQWVSIKLFALPTDADDRGVLVSLIRHVRYRDSYNGTGDRDMGTIHGPYLLRAITPESFFPVSVNEIEPLIRTWAEYAAPLPDPCREDMERELYPRFRRPPVPINCSTSAIPHSTTRAGAHPWAQLQASSSWS
jgi:hypothetical protein